MDSGEALTTIGDNVHRLRGKRPQRVVADAAGLSQPVLSRIEQGRNRGLTVEHLVKLAPVLDCTFADLICGVTA